MVKKIVVCAYRLTVIAAVCVFMGSCTDIKTVKISMPNLGKIPDGTYTGTEFIFPVRAKVRVEVAAGKIMSFTILKHFSSSHGKPAEQLAPLVVEKQTLLLDAVSGATFSSKVILKAGENALESAK
ncbi:MAG: FMN-binding protein [Spirochaetia bacterium]